LTVFTERSSEETMHPTVVTVMTREPITATPDMTYKQLNELLAEHGISAVPVVNHRGEPIGVVSEADLLPRLENRQDTTRPGLLSGRRVRQAWAKSHGLFAKDLMTTPARTVAAKAPLPAAAARLDDSGMRRLYVVDNDGVLVGVLSRRDVLGPVRRPDPEIRADIERDVLHRALWTDSSQARVAVEDGVATLVGRLESRSECERAGKLTAEVPGVIDVRNRLDFVWDDQDAHGPHPAKLGR
jgi:CBS domain-containing protein